MIKEEENILAKVAANGNYSKIILLIGIVFSLWLFVNTLISNVLVKARHSSSTFLELLGERITEPGILFLLVISVLYVLPYLLVAIVMKNAIFKNFFFYTSLIIFSAEMLFILTITYFPGSSTDSIAIAIIAPTVLIVILALTGILKLAEHFSKSH